MNTNKFYQAKQAILNKNSYIQYRNMCDANKEGFVTNEQWMKMSNEVTPEDITDNMFDRLLVTIRCIKDDQDYTAYTRTCVLTRTKPVCEGRYRELEAV